MEKPAFLLPAEADLRASDELAAAALLHAAEQRGQGRLGDNQVPSESLPGKIRCSQKQSLEERLVRQPHKFRGRMRTNPISPEKLYCRRDGRVN